MEGGNDEHKSFKVPDTSEQSIADGPDASEKSYGQSILVRPEAPDQSKGTNFMTSQPGR